MTALQVYGPFADARLEDFVRGFMKPLRQAREGAAPVKVDVIETGAAYVVKAELPGVAKDDIQVTVEGNQVTIAAEVKRASGQKDGERVLRSERYYGKVQRAFALGQPVDEDGAAAKYSDGILDLTLPKKAAAQAKRISIQ